MAGASIGESCSLHVKLEAKQERKGLRSQYHFKGTPPVVSLLLLGHFLKVRPSSAAGWEPIPLEDIPEPKSSKHLQHHRWNRSYSINLFNDYINVSPAIHEGLVPWFPLYWNPQVLNYLI
jgi:hypothetical protein